MYSKNSQSASEEAHQDDNRVRQFVILEHDSPSLHWDYLIEDGETLACWQLMDRPGKGTAPAARRIANHRRHYLAYEGPVSGNRGEVCRVFEGSLSVGHAWPASDEWSGLQMTIHDSDVGEHCTLLRDGDTEFWKFF